MNNGKQNTCLSYRIIALAKNLNSHKKTFTFSQITFLFFYTHILSYLISLTFIQSTFPIKNNNSKDFFYNPHPSNPLHDIMKKIEKI